jgi:hypothetical protein
MRALEESALGAHLKSKFITTVWFDFTYLPDKLNYLTPTKVPRQFAFDQALQQNFVVMADAIHQVSIAGTAGKSRSALLTA